MKFLFFFLFLGVAQATLFKDTGIYKDDMLRGNFRTNMGFLNKRDMRIPVNKDLIRIQMDIIRLLNNINHLNTDKTVMEICKTYRLEDRIDRFMDKKVVLDLVRMYKFDGFLNRDKVFNIMDDVHRHEVITITKALIGAKDLTEFFKLACWLRNHVNGGVFTYTLFVAVRNRDDCYGVILPPMYEIQPLKFFKNKVIQKALQLKMQGEIFDEKYARTLGIEMVDKNVYILKTDYTGINIDTHGEGRMTYFTEDIGLNNNYFMAHITTPFWIDYRTIGVTRHSDYRRGEWALFMHEQLLARYYMERLCNGLGEIPRFKWNMPIKTGYNPSLRHQNGLEYAIRPMNYVVNTVDNLWDLKTVKDFERRIRDAIDRGYIWTDDGQVLSLRNPEDIDRLGNMLQCNAATVNYRFYHGIHTAMRLLGNRRTTDDNTGVTPSVLESYDTMLRDPMYYQYMKRVLHYVHKFNNLLRPYAYDELFFKGVRVNDVKLDKLITYFDTFDVDITNVLNRDVREMTTNKDDMILMTRQVRLNHAPFNVDIDVTSDITTDCEVKIFLGPKYDSLNRKIHCDENRKNFMLLDRYTTTLKKGLNTITRNSRFFNLVTDDMHTTRKLITRVDKCLKGEEECFTKEVRHSVLIPDRLILPRGRRGGMTFKLFVTVTPITKTLTNIRYPLDRRIIHVKQFLSCDNFFLRDVTIFHKEGIVDKYTGDIKDSSSSESSESVETFKKFRTMKDGRRYDFMDTLRGRDIDSLENTYGRRTFDTRDKFLGKRMNSMENTYDRTNFNSKERFMGKRMNTMENIWDRRNFDSREDSRGGRSFESRENMFNRKYGTKLGRRFDSREDVSRMSRSMEDSTMDTSREFMKKRLFKNKIMRGRQYSDEDITNFDMKKMWLNKKGKFIHDKFF